MLIGSRLIKEIALGDGSGNEAGSDVLRIVALLAVSLVLPLALCADRPTVGSFPPEKLLDEPHLPNVFRLHDRVLSGGQPEGDKGFATLRRLGVKTVLSVDGAKPDVGLAKKHGLRYVHLPHGYDGVPDDRARELAKAVRELEGPVYIHCHHGKHRSPAAATVACVAAGFLAPHHAVAVLEAAGTSKSYRGLYESAQRVRRLDEKLLDELQVEFKETVDVPPLADAMVAIEHTHDHLQQVAQNKWRPLVEHPDLDPEHEALMLREHYTELLRTDDVQRRPERFRQLMRDAEERAQALEDAYREWDLSPGKSSLDRLDRAFKIVSRNCTSCHQQFRDLPEARRADR